ncbi:unnamed protein product [Ectocarpus sp. CCAP 1310/34]|nr:unnamed protein product [Ectocarpus sp. CCAP 1310/34]
MEQQQEEEAQDPTAKPVEGGKQQYPPPLPASWSPRLDVASAFLSDQTLEEDAAKLADLRLQIQASKLAFVVEKMREALVELGFTLRREEAAVGSTANTIQEFLDRTWAGRHVSRQGFSPLDCGGIECPVPFGYNRDGVDSLKISALRKECIAKFGSDRDGSGRGRSSRVAGGGAVVKAKGGSGGGGRGGCGGDAEDFFRSSCGFEVWRDMTFVFCEELGWVFLHQATKQAASVVKDMFSTVHCQEIGVLMTDQGNKATIEGLASAFASCDDVSVRIDGAIVKVAGAEQQVLQVSRAIEAIDNSAQRLYSPAYWYFQGPAVYTGIPAWFPMERAASNSLEHAFLHRTESNGESSASYSTGGFSYFANFVLMTQASDHCNAATGMVRAIKRVVTDRRVSPLPRCPSANVPLTPFRAGTTVSLVDVSEADERMVRDAVEFSYQDSAVIRVQHIWNSFLWEHYSQNAKSIGNEHMLFHGARSHAINSIMRTGFEKRLAGSINGAKFGQGCYFARDALLAAKYMAKPPCGGQIIMAKVLVGEFVRGDASMLIPPKMGTGERHYDTTTNDDYAPSLIVTYKDWQAYPMYLITFAPRET